MKLQSCGTSAQACEKSVCLRERQSKLKSRLTATRKSSSQPCKKCVDQVAVDTTTAIRGNYLHNRARSASGLVCREHDDDAEKLPLHRQNSS